VIAELIRSVIAEQPGGGAETTLTIAGGNVAPAANASRTFSIDTEGAAAADDLTNVDYTEFADGLYLMIRAANSGRVVTVKHAAGGAGQFSLPGGLDIVLDATTKWLLCKRTGTSIEVMGAFGFDAGMRPQTVRALTANTTLKASDSGKLITNAGAGGDLVHTLPAAAAGYVFEHANEAAHKTKYSAAGSDEIGDGASDSTAGGGIEVSAAVGGTLVLKAVSAGRWRVMSKTGTWTLS